MSLAGRRWTFGLFVGWRKDCAIKFLDVLLLTGVILPYFCVKVIYVEFLFY